MREYFIPKSASYNLRCGKTIVLPSNLPQNARVFRGAIAWNNLPNDIKDSKSLASFKSQTK